MLRAPLNLSSFVVLDLLVGSISASLKVINLFRFSKTNLLWLYHYKYVIACEHEQFFLARVEYCRFFKEFKMCNLLLLQQKTKESFFKETPIVTFFDLLFPIYV